MFFDEKKVSVDIGFIVFNFQTYPNLINFFKENDIRIEKSNMSFSVSVDNTKFEYCGKGLSGIFCNKSNLFNIDFLKMFFDIIKFYKKSDQAIISNDKITLGEYLKINKLSKTFVDYHIIPMVSAIWSMPPRRIISICPFVMGSNVPGYTAMRTRTSIVTQFQVHEK